MFMQSPVKIVSDFSIDVNIVNIDSIYGGITLCFDEDTLGGPDHLEYLWPAISTLIILRNRAVDTSAMLLNSWDECPPYQELANLGGWSWDGYFDKANLVYFCVLADGYFIEHDRGWVCVAWSFCEECVSGLHHNLEHVHAHAVPFALFDAAVDNLVHRLDSIRLSQGIKGSGLITGNET